MGKAGCQTKLWWVQFYMHKVVKSYSSNIVVIVTQ